MKSKTRVKKKPSPEDLLAEVKGKSPSKTYEFEDYIEVIHEMQQKDYSYAQVASFLQERLGIAVSRGQVYRAYQQWLEYREYEDKQRAEDEAEARRQGLLDVEPLTEEDRYAQEVAVAGGSLLKHLMEKYSGKGSEFYLNAVNHVRFVLDEEARAENAAAEEDKKREHAKNSK